MSSELARKLARQRKKFTHEEVDDEAANEEEGDEEKEEDNDNDEELGTADPTTGPKNAATSSPQREHAAPGQAAIVKRVSLFSESDGDDSEDDGVGNSAEDDLFSAGPAQPVANQRIKRAVSLFDDSDDDTDENERDQMFGKANAASAKTSPVAPASATSTQQQEFDNSDDDLDLEDDDEDEDDDGIGELDDDISAALSAPRPKALSFSLELEPDNSIGGDDDVSIEDQLDAALDVPLVGRKRPDTKRSTSSWLDEPSPHAVASKSTEEDSADGAKTSSQVSETGLASHDETSQAQLAAAAEQRRVRRLSSRSRRYSRGSDNTTTTADADLDELRELCAEANDDMNTLFGLASGAGNTEQTSSSSGLVDAYNELLSEELEADFSSTGSLSRMHLLRRSILNKYGRKDLGSPRAAQAASAESDALVAASILAHLSDDSDNDDADGDLFQDHDGVYGAAADEEDSVQNDTDGKHVFRSHRHVNTESGYGLFGEESASDDDDDERSSSFGRNSPTKPLAIAASSSSMRKGSIDSDGSPSSSLRAASGPLEGPAGPGLSTHVKEAHRESIASLQRALLSGNHGTGTDGEDGDNAGSFAEEDSLFAALDQAIGKKTQAAAVSHRNGAPTGARVRSLDVEDLPEAFEFNEHWRTCFSEFVFAIRKRYNVHSKIASFRGKLLEVEQHCLRQAVVEKFYREFKAHLALLQVSELGFADASSTILQPTSPEVSHDEWVEKHLQANSHALMKRMEKKLCLLIEEYRGGDGKLAVVKLAKQVGRVVVREGLEELVSKYLTPLVATTALLKKDLLLKLQLQRHSFVKLTHLDIPTDPPPCNDMVLSVAAAELRRMNQVVTPAAKMGVLVKTCQLLFNALNLGRARDSSSRPGADDFLPILIYVVLKARVVNLCWNVRMVESFRHPSRLQTKEGYFLASLQSAVQFLAELSQSSLTIEETVYNESLGDSVLELPGRRRQPRDSQ